MAPLTYSRTLVAKTPENIRDVQAMFGEVRDYLSGTNLTGAANFANDSIGPGKIADNAVMASNFGVSAPGWSNNVVASWRSEQSLNISGLNGANVSMTVSPTGQQPGDIFLIHRSYRIDSANISGRVMSSGYSDSVQGSIGIDTSGFTTVIQSLGFGVPPYATVGMYAAVAKSTTGATVGLGFTNVGGSNVPTGITGRLVVILLRLT